MRTYSVLPIAAFFVLAFAISFGFGLLPKLIYLSVDFRDILCGFGPLLAGLICYAVFKTPTRFSIGGTQPTKAWGILLITAITFLITNTKASLTTNLLIVSSQLVYCFGEEFGWRHYLQSAVAPMKKWIQVIIIGLLWFAWHYSWIADPVKAMMGTGTQAPAMVGIAMVLALLILFSLFLKWSIDRTQSILFPTLLHFVLKTNGSTALVAVVLVVIALLTWDKWTLGNKPESALPKMA